jgi:flagellar hook protein FlgE
MAPQNQTAAPEATTESYISGILDKNDSNVASDDGYAMSLTVYDDLGYTYTAKFSVKQVLGDDGNPVDGSFRITMTDLLDSNGDQYATEQQLAAIWPGYYLSYDTNDGTFIGIGTTTEAAAAGTTQSMSLNLANVFTNGTDAQNNVLSNFSNVNVDFSRSLNYNNGGTSTMKPVRGTYEGDGAGKKVGALTGLTVTNDGKIYGSYDNGNTILLCQIAAAQFANASGLEKVGENCYQTTLNSGDFDGIGIEISADGSSMAAGELEMSNVDLSGEFTSMIVTQRGFQANSRVITTSDTLLEELINLKR